MTEMPMTVCGVIVTYGDRFRFLEKVLDGLTTQAIDHIVIIDNGSAAASRIALQNFVSGKDNITLHRFETNEGSAKGFKTGISLASETRCQFIWILDDDNLPKGDSLAPLKAFWKEKRLETPSSLIALSSMREDRQVFVNALRSRRSDGLLWPTNSFLGFHMNLLGSKIAERFSSGQENQKATSITPMKLDAGFYGGLFFRKDILQEVGYPNEDMVLYADDFCFTYAITLKKGEIWLVPESVVSDIDKPFYLPEKKGLLYHSSLDGKNDAQIYYATRNSLYCTQKFFLTSRMTYLFNKVVFIILITFMALVRGKMNRLMLIYQAIRDGESGRLGKNVQYPLN